MAAAVAASNNKKGWEILDHASLTMAESNFTQAGFVCLSKILSKEVCADWLRWSEEHIQHCCETLHRNHHIEWSSGLERSTIDEGGIRITKEYALGQGVKHGFREVVMRSPGRYEFSLLHPSPTDSTIIPRPSMQELESNLAHLIPKLIHVESMQDLQLCHLSLLISMPGATDQTWHVDGGHVNVQKHLPCHVLNVFVPLVDLTDDNGPTELRPGSHYLTRNLAPMMLAARARKTLISPVQPMLGRGDALVFDYRTLHRGRANLSSSNRPILVLTYAAKWYKDICNFPSNSMYTEKKL